MVTDITLSQSHSIPRGGKNQFLKLYYKFAFWTFFCKTSRWISRFFQILCCFEVEGLTRSSKTAQIITSWYASNFIQTEITAVLVFLGSNAQIWKSHPKPWIFKKFSLFYCIVLINTLMLWILFHILGFCAYCALIEIICLQEVWDYLGSFCALKKKFPMQIFDFGVCLVILLRVL